MSIAASLIINQARINQKNHRRVDSALSAHGISFTEYLIMYALHNAPANTLRRIDLAESIGVTASGVTRILAPMEKIKLIQKEANPRDARVSLVKLSDTGKELFSDASISFDDVSCTLTKTLTADELSNLLNLGEKLIN